MINTACCSNWEQSLGIAHKPRKLPSDIDCPAHHHHLAAAHLIEISRYLLPQAATGAAAKLLCECGFVYTLSQVHTNHAAYRACVAVSAARRHMGRLFIEPLEGRVYCCGCCGAHLARVDELVSKVG